MYLNTTISSYIQLNWQISSPEAHPDEGKMISRWLSDHQGCLLIDKPGIGFWEMWFLLKEIPEAMHNRLLLGQHHELRREFDLRGLHFGADAPYAPEDYRGLLLGMTVYGFEEALRWSERMNYLFLHLSRDYAKIEVRCFKQSYKGKAALLDMPRRLSVN